MTQITKTKKARRESLREELTSREYLRQIHSILESDWKESDPTEQNIRLNAYFRLLAKTLPDAKDQPLAIKVDASEKLSEQAGAVVRAVLGGEVTPTEAAAVMNILSKASSIRLDDDLEARIQKLEEEAAENE